MRSKLQPYRADIEEALAAGTSLRNVARTYGVHHSTVEEFLGRRSTTGVQRKQASRAADPLAATQYDTLRSCRLAVERSRHLTEEIL